MICITAVMHTLSSDMETHVVHQTKNNIGNQLTAEEKQCITISGLNLCFGTPVFIKIKFKYTPVLQ